MGLQKIGVRSVACLREPSLGPVFGIKGGGTGGGAAQIEPANDINLHFTGDIHAIGSAHNLLAALVDNDLHFGHGVGAKSGLDARRASWTRVVDMNDRALREVMVGLGGRAQGLPREASFDITAASEVMAILGLARSREDLAARLSRVVVGRRLDLSDVTAADLEAPQAMTALLADAIMPNLAQTSEGTPALVHGGPFANIAHGCSSVLATEMGLRYGEVAVTEAGFGMDLGGEKFLDIKCREAGIWPDAVVLVATLRALKVHGGVPAADASKPSPDALRRGLANLDQHVRSLRAFGLHPVVSLNLFPDDGEEELAILREHVAHLELRLALCRGFSEGGAGSVELAEAVKASLDAGESSGPAFAYDLEASYAGKLEALATKIYGAGGVDIEPHAAAKLQDWERRGLRLPVCVAKTPLSLSDDPSAVGGPRPDHRVQVRDVRLSAGAGFVVALLGDVMTMPGLPRVPASARVRVEPDGTIRGLMQND
jgi:formate--tetrahydrofolate ligase